MKMRCIYCEEAAKLEAERNNGRIPFSAEQEGGKNCHRCGFPVVPVVGLDKCHECDEHISPTHNYCIGCGTPRGVALYNPKKHRVGIPSEAEPAQTVLAA